MPFISEAKMNDEQDEHEEIIAVPSPIVNGNEKDISALYIKINEVNELGEEKVLKAIKDNLYLSRAIISRSPEGTFLALFNLNHVQNNHELTAVKTALAIQNDVRNVKSLSIGFGINSGKAIVSDIKKGMINYTCFGNLVNIAKKLSINSKHNVLFTQNIHSKISNNLKAEEVKELFDYFNMKIYSLSKVIDRERYDNYVKEFMNRMKI